MKSANFSDPKSKQKTTIQRAVIAAAGIGVLVSGVYFASLSGTNPETYGNDFSVYYHAAREVIAGRDPYQHSIGDWTPYVYPPLLSELIVPLALLPLPLAAYLWFLISAASIAFAAWVSVGLAIDNRAFNPANEDVSRSALLRAAVAGCAVLMVLRFVLDTFSLGQVNGVVAALVVAHLHLYSRNRKGLSALALVIAVSIKLTPALFIVYHAAKLRLKFAAICTILFVSVTTVSFLTFGSDATAVFQTFVGRTLKNEQGYDLAYSGNQSLRGAIARLSVDPNEVSQEKESEARSPANLPSLLVSLVFFAFAIIAAFRARSELSAAAPLFCCMVMLSPLSWKAHYVILIPAAASLLSQSMVSVKKQRWIFVVLAMSFALFNLTSPRVIGLPMAEWADAHSLVLVAAVLMFGACLLSVKSAD